MCKWAYMHNESIPKCVLTPLHIDMLVLSTLLLTLHSCPNTQAWHWCLMELLNPPAGFLKL